MNILENSTVRLRSLELIDLEFLFNVENNSNLWEVSNTVAPFSKYILEKYIKNASNDIFSAKQLRLVIESKEEKRPAGFIDLFDYDPIHMRAGIGIVIIESERRKHFAENALYILINYAFKNLKLSQLYCNISEDNHSSIKLFEKAGFKITGKKEKWINSESGFKDVYFLQLINV